MLVVANLSKFLFESKSQLKIFIWTLTKSCCKFIKVPFWKQITTVIEYRQIANSITCHIRLKVETYDGEVIVQDGVGACPLQFKAGSKITDFENLQPNAVMMALPAAKSYAIKDAADHLGRIFGRDLNKKDLVPFISPDIDKKVDEDLSKLQEEVAKKINSDNI